MPQIQAPVNFTNGQTVDADSFNNHVNGAIVLPGIITDWSNISTNTVATDDSFLIYDLSSTSLKKATISDLLNSSLPITTSILNGATGQNLSISPAAGYQLSVTTGASFGGNVLFSGTITSAGNAIINGNLNVNGSTATLPAVTASSVSSTGDTTVGGNLTVTGSITQSGITPKTLYDIVEYTIQDQAAISGTANDLTNFATFFTTPTALTKPAGEIWVFEFTAVCHFGWTTGSGSGLFPAFGVLRLTNNSTSIDYYRGTFCHFYGGQFDMASSTCEFTYVSPASETFSTTLSIKGACSATRTIGEWSGAADTAVMRLGVTTAYYWVNPNWRSVTSLTPGKLRIFKYKV